MSDKEDNFVIQIITAVTASAETAVEMLSQVNEHGLAVLVIYLDMEAQGEIGVIPVSKL